MNQSRLPKPLAILPILGLLAACTSTNPHLRPGVKDPEIEKAAARKRNEKAATEARFKDPNRIRLNVQRAIAQYVVEMDKPPAVSRTKNLQALDRVIRQDTLNHFDMFLLDAGGDDPYQRGIALSALGFAEEPKGLPLAHPKGGKPRVRNYDQAALNPLVTALSDANPEVLRSALFGLAMLGSQDTPLRTIGDIAEDSKRSEDVRVAATFALLKVQPRLTQNKQERILPIWSRLLSQPVGEVAPRVVGHALKGLGLFRRKQDAALVEPYLEHPVPLVRFAACIALGRQLNQASWEKLLARLGPVETNPNVRLAARKALQTLAGGKDREWDIKAWRQLFERS